MENTLRSRQYLGRIENVVGGSNKFLEISFLRQKKAEKRSYFCFPNIEDKQKIDKRLIKQAVEVQNIGRSRFALKNIDIDVNQLE